MRVLHLFAGAGGGCLADRLLGHRCVGYVEWEPYCQKVLQARIADGLLDSAPIFGDVREFVSRGYAREYRGVADVVAGGFPCQPFSVAGKRAGSADERNMWPAFREVVGEVRPRYVFAENVPGLLTWDGGSYFAQILKDLAEIGYRARWTVLGADDVGAPHRRKRLWILADAASERGEQAAERRQPGVTVPFLGGSWWSIDPADIPDTEREQLTGERERQGLGRGFDCASSKDVPDAEEWRPQAPTQTVPDYGCTSDEWPADIGRRDHPNTTRPTESRVGRVAHWVAHRVDRLRALGNGQVPAVAATAWRLLKEAPIGADSKYD